MFFLRSLLMSKISSISFLLNSQKYILAKVLLADSRIKLAGANYQVFLVPEMIIFIIVMF